MGAVGDAGYDVKGYGMDYDDPSADVGVAVGLVINAMSGLTLLSVC